MFNVERRSEMHKVVFHFGVLRSSVPYSIFPEGP
jgi:hypothetical protein